MTLSNTLSVYRNLLKYAQSLPKTSRNDTISKIKQQFRANASETSPEKLNELLQHANSSLGYLKIVTPRKMKDQQGHTTIVFGSNSNEPKSSKAVSNWTGKNMDPDSVKRHFNSLNRAGFKNNTDAKGFF